MAIPKGFTMLLQPHGETPGLWERAAFGTMSRTYKRRLANMTYLPEEIKSRVMTYSVDLPNMKEYKKMSATERYNLWEQIDKFLNLKSTTKRGYSQIVNKRYDTWSKKVPGLTHEQFDNLMKKGLFNTAKKFLDSNQIVSAMKGILQGGNEEDLKQLMSILEKTTQADNDRRETQMEFSRLLSKVMISPD